MRVSPGQTIPFWFKLWDGNPSRYVVAHVTSLTGIEQPGSPYLLSHSARGVYVGTGPVVGIQDLVVDYEVYSDVGLSSLDRRYLPNSELIEADISVSAALSQILGKLSSLTPDTITGFIESVLLQGNIDSNQLSGVIDIQTGQGSIEQSEIHGDFNTTIIQGDLE